MLGLLASGTAPSAVPVGIHSLGRQTPNIASRRCTRGTRLAGLAQDAMFAKSLEGPSRDILVTHTRGAHGSARWPSTGPKKLRALDDERRKHPRSMLPARVTSRTAARPCTVLHQRRRCPRTPRRRRVPIYDGSSRSILMRSLPRGSASLFPERSACSQNSLLFLLSRSYESLGAEPSERFSQCPSLPLPPLALLRLAGSSWPSVLDNHGALNVHFGHFLLVLS